MTKNIWPAVMSVLLMFACSTEETLIQSECKKYGENVLVMVMKAKRSEEKSIQFEKAGVLFRGLAWIDYGPSWEKVDSIYFRDETETGYGYLEVRLREDDEVDVQVVGRVWDSCFSEAEDLIKRQGISVRIIRE